MYLCDMFKKIIQWWNNRQMYVIADATDSSVTISRKLYRHLDVSAELAAAKIFVFHIPETGHYAFMLNPDIEQPTQLSDLQYNSKHRCIGFESLCPTVARIFYDYGISVDRCRLMVTVQHNVDGRTYYQIEPPHSNK